MTPESGEVDETDERETRRRWRRLSYIAGQGEEGGVEGRAVCPCQPPLSSPATGGREEERRSGE